MSHFIVASRSLALVTFFMFSAAVQSETTNGQTADSRVPENATLSRHGEGWYCSPGYRKANNVCEALVIPDNAYLTNKSYGSGWACERGYMAKGTECVVIKVPDNAYLLNYPNQTGWRCDRGYKPVADSCVAIAVPEHGYLSGTEYRPNCD